jgi:quercetin dioxygenase-like cupin family protein
MRRNKFIASLVAVAALPSIAFAKISKRAKKGFKIAAGEGRIHGHITLKGVNQNIMDLKISGSDTDGDLAIFEQTSISPGRGTPLHVHPNQDELFYVLEGHYYFQVGDDKHELTQGDSIFLPRNVPHAWTQISNRGRMTVLFQPAGKMENFFVTVAALSHEPTPEEMQKLFVENDMKIVGPPLTIPHS